MVDYLQVSKTKFLEETVATLIMSNVQHLGHMNV